MIRRLALASVIVALAFPFVSARPASAAVDTWRVLHVGLESFPASDDTDGDGVVNTWGGSQGQTTCTPVGRKGKKERCTTTPGTVAGSPLYQAWQTDVSCFEPTVEAWSDYQIDIYQESVFIQTNQAIENSPYSFMWSGLAAQYGFENFDVIMVWTGYTQATGWDGGTWNGTALGTGYSYVGLYGLAGVCPDPASNAPWPVYVPAHEFVHTVTGLYNSVGYPVCGTYEYPYPASGLEWEHHHRILTNTATPTVCSNTGMTSTGVPPEAWASGSWMDHY
jgi:hypothetical protein